MRAGKVQCISLIAVSGLCLAQAGQREGAPGREGVGPVGVVESDQVLADDWCLTDRVWAERAAALGLWERGGCPTEGDCDEPAVRDAHIPGASTPIKTLRLRFVVFRNDDGSDPAATEAEINAQAEQMNVDFAPYRVQFVYTYDFIDDATYRYVTSGEIYPMRGTYAESPETQCNIYVSDYSGVGGLGTFPWDPLALTDQGGILIDKDYFGPGQSIMTHEMGHNLGLWHTHHGVSEVGECSPCYERADGLNGDTTGDFASDTPPTPVNTTCLPPGGIDPCSDTPWGQTQTENYMGYGIDCWSLFTDQQAGRVHCWTEAALPGWLTCPGDLDADGDTDQADLGVLLSDWECTGGNCPGDLDGDGDTDQADLGILLADWGCAS